MPRWEIAERQAQWARFRAWEESRPGPAGGLSEAAALPAVGEVVEFYLEVSGAAAVPAQRSVPATTAAVRRLHHLLRAVAPP